MFIALKEFIYARFVLPRLSRKGLMRLQNKRYKKQMAFIKQYSPFYRDRDSLPVMTKTDMMTNYNQINTRGLDLDTMLDMALEQETKREFDSKYHGISAGLSSGTSGERGIYTLSRQEELMWAGNALAKLLPKPFLRSYNIAFFMRANNPIYSQLNKPFFTFTYYDIFRPFEELMAELKAQGPNIIIAPATVLWDLALYFERKKWELPSCLKVISVAEVLDNGEELAKRFNLHHIDQVYQCTEGFLAYTCSAGNFHLNEDGVLFEREWLSDDSSHKRFIPIITDLKRRVQPMIRYQMTDILIHKEGSCPCGSPLAMIEGIEGRQDDYLVLNGRTVYADQIRRIFLLTKEVIWYQVKQLIDGSLVIYLDTGEHSQSAVEQKLLNAFLELGAESITFKDFKRDRTNKLKRVMREKEEIR